MANLLKKVLKYISDNSLLNPGDTVIVAVSGGADSMALLDILTNLKELRINLVAAHLDHMLRGDESSGDAAFVRDAAIRYGVPFEIRTQDIRLFSHERKLSLEEGGREARYAWFDEVAAKYGAQATALGHHADDQAETVLMRLLRGAGATGLSGISPGFGSRYVRPLLCCKRIEIEEYLRARNLPFRTDASNKDTRFLRNRIRHELLPNLETYNASIRDRLVATAEILFDDEQLLESVTELSFNRLAEIGEKLVRFNVNDLAAELRGLRLRLYRRAIRSAKGNLDHITLKHLRKIDDLSISGKANSHFRLPGHLQVSKSYDNLTIASFEADEGLISFEMIIDGPGRYHLPNGMRLSITASGPPEDLKNQPSNRAHIDAGSAPFPWTVRTYRNGDRFIPLGMKGSKKIKDFFIDMKIPALKRRSVPLIFAGGKLLWIAGMRLAEEARLSESTEVVITAELVD